MIAELADDHLGDQTLPEDVISVIAVVHWSPPYTAYRLAEDNLIHHGTRASIQRMARYQGTRTAEIVKASLHIC